MPPHSPHSAMTHPARWPRLLLILAACLALGLLAAIHHWRVRAMVEQQVQTAVRHAAVDSRLTPKPPLGFNDWNAVHCNVSEALIQQTAAAMVTNGLRAAGYRYVIVDDCWSAPSRDARGNLVADPDRFPHGLRALGAYIHSLGLKFGLYADVGTTTCGSYPGSFGHERDDAATFASWGVDYLKVDWCHVPYALFPDYTPDEVAQVLYARMSASLRATRRPMVFSVSNASDPSIHPWVWGRSVSDLWRTTPDIADTWTSILVNADENLQHGSVAGPGHWNDPDMLEVGNGGMTPAEDQAHFSLWSIMAAPLILGTDVRFMRRSVSHIVTNREVIAIDQDPLGIQAAIVFRHGDGEVLTKPLANGDRAVLFLNRGAPQLTLTVRAEQVGMARAPGYVWSNLWTHTTRISMGSISESVPPRSSVLLRVRAVGRSNERSTT
jgi:alpha-galactosidase